MYIYIYTKRKPNIKTGARVPLATGGDILPGEQPPLLLCRARRRIVGTQMLSNPKVVGQKLSHAKFVELKSCDTTHLGCQLWTSPLVVIYYRVNNALFSFVEHVVSLVRILVSFGFTDHSQVDMRPFSS